MRCYSTLAAPGCRETSVVVRLLAFTCLICAFFTPIKAHTQQATILNPQPSDKISRQNRVNDTSGAKGVYLLNGTCHDADKVFITITRVPAAVDPNQVTNQPVTVKGNVWEYAWKFELGNPTATYEVKVTPAKNGKTNTTVTPVSFQLVSNVAFGGDLALLPGSVVPSVYVGRALSVPVTAAFPISVLVRLFTSTVPPYTATITLKQTTSVDKVSTVKIEETANGVQALNNDDALGKSLPSTFTLGNNGGVQAGINTVEAEIAIGADMETYKRSIIVDATPPQVVTTLFNTVTSTLNGATPFPAENRVQLTGTVKDVLNGSAFAPGGIASVEVVITRPDAMVERLPALLEYDDNPEDDVTWTVNYNTTSKPAGIYSIYAVIMDNAGNVTHDAFSHNSATNATVGYSVSIDQSNKPMPTIPSHATPPYFLKGSVDLTLRALTNNLYTKNTDFNYELHSLIDGIDNVIIPSTATHNFTASPSFDTPRTYSWNTTLARDGTHSLTLQATDKQKNSQTSVAYAVIVDNTPPTGRFTAPVANSFVKASQTKTLTIEINDNIVHASNEITVTGQDDLGNAITFPAQASATISNLDRTLKRNHDAAGVFSITANYTPPVNHSADGDRVITLTLTDKASNVRSDVEITLRVDTQPPTVDGIDSPLAAAFLPNGNIPVKGTISDSASFAGNVVTWRLYDVETDAVNPLYTGQLLQPTSAKFVGTYNTASVTQTTHTLRVVAEDAAGNVSAEKTVTITVDRTPPEPTFETAPAQDAFIRSAVTLKGAYGDTNPASFRILVDGVPITTAAELTMNTTWNTAMAPDGKPDGTHIIDIEVTDLAGNVGTTLRTIANPNDPQQQKRKTRTVKVDNTSPVVKILTPTEDSTVATDVTRIRGTVVDANPPSTAIIRVQKKDDPTHLFREVSVPVTDGVAETTLPKTYEGPTPATSDDIPIDTNAELEFILKATDLTGNPEAASDAIKARVGAAEPVAIRAVKVNGGTINKKDNNTIYYVKDLVEILGIVNVLNLDTVASSPADRGWHLMFHQDAYPDPNNPMQTIPAVDIELGRGETALTGTPKKLTTTLDPWNTGTVYNNKDTRYSPARFTLTANDLSGVTQPAFSVSVDVVVDNKEPVFDFDNTVTPMEDTYIKGEISIAALVTDEPFLESWTIVDTYLDPMTMTPRAPVSVDNGNNDTIQTQWKTTDRARYGGDGKHTLKITVTDKAQNPKVRERFFNVDNTPPKPTFTTPPTPSTGDYLSGQVMLQGAAGDDNPMVFKFLAKLGLQTFTLVTYQLPQNLMGDKQHQWNTDEKIPNTTTPKYPDGEYELSLETTDKAGNPGTTDKTDPAVNRQSRVVIVDNTEPIAKILFPLNNSTLLPNQQIQVSVVDTNTRPTLKVMVFNTATPAQFWQSSTVGVTNGLAAVAFPTFYNNGNENAPSGPPIKPGTHLTVQVELTDLARNAPDPNDTRNTLRVAVIKPADQPLTIEEFRVNGGSPILDKDGIFYLRGSVEIRGRVNVANLDTNPAKGWDLKFQEPLPNPIMHDIGKGTAPVTGEKPQPLTVGTALVANDAWDTTKPGQYPGSESIVSTVKLSAVDLDTTSDPRPVEKTVVVDNKAPDIVRVFANSGGDDNFVRNVNGSVTIRAIITETYPESFEMKVNGTLLTTSRNRLTRLPDGTRLSDGTRLPPNSYLAEHEWETDNPDENPNIRTANGKAIDGVRTIEVVAVDKAGNRNTKSVPMVVVNTPPKIKFVELSSGVGALNRIIRSVLPANTPDEPENYLFPTPPVVGGGPGNLDVRDKVGVNFEIYTSAENTLKAWELRANSDVIANEPGPISLSSTRTSVIRPWHTANTIGGNPQFPDGRNTLRLFVVDKAGHTVETRPFVVIVDNSRPDPKLAPLWLDASILDKTDNNATDKAFVNKEVLLFGTVTESNLPESGEAAKQWSFSIDTGGTAGIYNVANTPMTPRREFQGKWSTLEKRHPDHKPGTDLREYRLTWHTVDVVGNIGETYQDVYVGDPAARLTILGSSLKKEEKDASKLEWHDYDPDDRKKVVYTNTGQNVIRGELKNWSRYQLLGTNVISDPLNPTTRKAREIKSDRNGRVETKKNHTVTWSLAEGRTILNLLAINDNQNTSNDPSNAVNGEKASSSNQFHSDFARVDIVVDNKPPVVKMLAPQNINGKPFPAAPGSILTIVFDLENPGAGNGASDRAPFQLLHEIDKDGKLTNNLVDVPDVKMEVTEAGFSGALYTAIFRSDLLQPNGKATVTKREDGGVRITWQIPVVPTLYAYGKIYTVKISGVADLVGNSATSQEAKFQVSAN